MARLSGSVSDTCFWPLSLSSFKSSSYRPLRSLSLSILCLMDDHRRHTDQIARFPGMARALVQIIAAALDDQQKLFENMPVHAAPLARRDFLRHHIQTARG